MWTRCNNAPSATPGKSRREPRLKPSPRPDGAAVLDAPGLSAFIGPALYPLAVSEVALVMTVDWQELWNACIEMLKVVAYR